METDLKQSAGLDPGVPGEDLERIEALLRFSGGRAAARITRIEAGLGQRRFYRVLLEGPDALRLIARIEPEATETPGPFAWLPEPALEPLRSFLEERGLPVPRSYAHDADRGIDLLEDVGTRTLAQVDPDQVRSRYLEACSMVPRLQRLEAPSPALPAFARVFDLDLVRTKAKKLIHWGWPGLLGRDPTPAERGAIETGFDAIGALLCQAPQRLAHRDFKAENLHLRPSESGSEELVMIDVQGAFLAPPEYDLVCLLRDLQVELADELAREAFEATRPALPDTTSDPAAREEANRRFEAIAVVRLAKDVSHVVDAARSRGDRRRWHEIPRGLELLESSAKALADTFPPARALNSVIQTLTRDAQLSDMTQARKGS